MFQKSSEVKQYFRRQVFLGWHCFKIIFRFINALQISNSYVGVLSSGPARWRRQMICWNWHSFWQVDSFRQLLSQRDWPLPGTCSQHSETYFDINTVGWQVCSDLSEHVWTCGKHCDILKQACIYVNLYRYITIYHDTSISNSYPLSKYLFNGRGSDIYTDMYSAHLRGKQFMGRASWDILGRQRVAARGTMRHAHIMRSGKGDRRRQRRWGEKERREEGEGEVRPSTLTCQVKKWKKYRKAMFLRLVASAPGQITKCWSRSASSVLLLSAFVHHPQLHQWWLEFHLSCLWPSRWDHLRCEINQDKSLNVLRTLKITYFAKCMFGLASHIVQPLMASAMRSLFDFLRLHTSTSTSIYVYVYDKVKTNRFKSPSMPATVPLSMAACKMSISSALSSLGTCTN